MTESQPEVVVLDVGHGNSTLIMDEDWSVLVDVRKGGVVDDALRHFGVTMLADVIVSHSDADHCDGLATLVLGEPCGVRRIHLKPDPLKNTPAWRDLIVALREPEVRGAVEVSTGLAKGQTITSPSGRVVIEVVGPTGNAVLSAPHQQIAGSITSNGLSTILRILVDGEPQLFLPGDMDASSFETIRDGGLDIQAKTLVFPHHGGTPGGPDTISFTNDLLEAVRPEHVIFSVNRNEGRFPRPEIVSSVINSAEAPRVSCTQLSRICAPNLPLDGGTHLNVLPSAGQPAACCAGSLHLAYSPASESPGRDDHRQFILANAPEAMCMARHVAKPGPTA